jgi:transcriptional regulator with XRE-family HTH domain
MELEISKWVKEARRHGHLTLEQLGERMGVTKSNVWGWENAKHEPSVGQWLRIAALTGYPPLPGGEAVPSLPAEILRLARRLASITDAETRASIVLSMKTQVDLALELQEQKAQRLHPEPTVRRDPGQ